MPHSKDARNKPAYTQSILELRKELLAMREIAAESRRKGQIWLLITAAVALVGLTMLRDTAGNYLNLLETALRWGLLALIPMAISRAFFSRAQSAQRKMEQLESILKQKLNYQVCQHREPCGCVEEFLAESEKRYGVNLRW